MKPEQPKRPIPQVVDPFVVSKVPRPQLVNQTRPAASRTTGLKPKPVGISGVDGLLPVRPVAHLPAPKLPAPGRRPLPRGPLHVQYLPKQAVPAPAPKPTPQPVMKPVSKPAPEKPSKLKQPKQAKQPRKAAKISTWALVGTLIIGGLSLFSVEFGQLALAVYAIVAIWRRWPSQQTFALALAMFGGIIIASLLSSFGVSQLDPLQQIAENLAVYAFLLLCIGTISLAREVRHDTSQPTAV